MAAEHVWKTRAEISTVFILPECDNRHPRQLFRFVLKAHSKQQWREVVGERRDGSKSFFFFFSFLPHEASKHFGQRKQSRVYPWLEMLSCWRECSKGVEGKLCPFPLLQEHLQEGFIQSTLQGSYFLWHSFFGIILMVKFLLGFWDVLNVAQSNSGLS